MASAPITQPSKIADKLAFLRNHPIFGILGPSLLQQLKAHALEQSVVRGKTIFTKGEVGTSLFAILEGQVKVVSFSMQGKNAVLNYLGPGDIFGEIALLDGGERTADVTAVTNCKLMVIERRDFLPLVHSSPDIAQKLIEVLCARLRNTSRQVEEVMFLDLSRKLAMAILRFSNARAAPGKRKVLLTQSEIAQIIGASRESTNKQLREWEDRQWIRLERGGLVILSPQSLMDHAGEASA
jgi:CRP-like cAMP-binding protein